MAGVARWEASANKSDWLHCIGLCANLDYAVPWAVALAYPPSYCGSGFSRDWRASRLKPLPQYAPSGQHDRLSYLTLLDTYKSSNTRPGYSSASLMATRNSTASRPSMMRWS